MYRCKVTVDIQDGWGKDAEGIRNVNSCSESADYFITFFIINVKKELKCD